MAADESVYICINHGLNGASSKSPKKVWDTFDDRAEPRSRFCMESFANLRLGMRPSSKRSNLVPSLLEFRNFFMEDECYQGGKSRHTIVQVSPANGATSAIVMITGLRPMCWLISHHMIATHITIQFIRSKAGAAVEVFDGGESEYLSVVGQSIPLRVMPTFSELWHLLCQVDVPIIIEL